VSQLLFGFAWRFAARLSLVVCWSSSKILCCVDWIEDTVCECSAISSLNCSCEDRNSIIVSACQAQIIRTTAASSVKLIQAVFEREDVA
jgi:hypothetical protein